MSVLLFSTAASILLLEGWLIARYFIHDRFLRWTLALPLAALTNVLLFFILTVAHVPLRMMFIVTGHGVIILGLFAVQRVMVRMPQPGTAAATCKMFSSTPPGVRPISILSLFIILSAFFYSFSHAVLLPTFQYDAATNWIGRSKVSFVEERIVFDAEGSHAFIRKPHYPFLLHALHITANLGRQTWSDRSANTLAFLLTWSMLLSVGGLATRMRGRFMGLLSVALLLSIPLFSVHIGEGYADHTLALFAALSFQCFAYAPRPGTDAAQAQNSAAPLRGRGLIGMSALFAAAAVWTKAEGFFFVFIPWLIIVLTEKFVTKACHPELVEGRHAAPNVLVRHVILSLSKGHHDTFGAIALACALSLPWPLFTAITGLSLTPHGSADLRFGLHVESVRRVLESLFLSGSFGVLWYALPVGLVAALRRRGWGLPLLFGALPFLMILAIYVFTPNAEYLANAQSFDRQMLTPAVLLTLGTLLLKKGNRHPSLNRRDFFWKCHNCP